MSVTLAIAVSPFSRKSALIAGGELQEIILHDLTAVSITDRLIWGRVVRVDQKLNAAFVDGGAGEPYFLHAKDVRNLAGKAKGTGISQLVAEGQYLIVQGLRDPDGDKSGRVSADILLTGRHLSYRLFATENVASEQVAKRLRLELVERADRLLPKAGFVLRPASAEARDPVVVAEAQALIDAWAALQKSCAKLNKPSILPEHVSPFEGLALRFAASKISAVIIDDPAAKAQVKRAFPDASVDVAARGAVFAQAGVEERLQALSGAVVGLPSGARLVLQPTLAGMVIDVDSNGSTLGNALKINLEAAREIARQIRLRNIGGTILVDFIDLSRAHERKTLDTAIKNALSRDLVQVQSLPISPLGIVQISRAKRGRTLLDWRSGACSACAGTGQTPSLASLAEQLWVICENRRMVAKRIDLAKLLHNYLRAHVPDWLKSLPAREVNVVSYLSGGWQIVD